MESNKRGNRNAKSRKINISLIQQQERLAADKESKRTGNSVKKCGF